VRALRCCAVHSMVCMGRAAGAYWTGNVQGV
jgi:hypothetical protein